MTYRIVQVFKNRPTIETCFIQYKYKFWPFWLDIKKLDHDWDWDGPSYTEMFLTRKEAENRIESLKQNA